MESLPLVLKDKRSYFSQGESRCIGHLIDICKPSIVSFIFVILLSHIRNTSVAANVFWNEVTVKILFSFYMDGAAPF